MDITRAGDRLVTVGERGFALLSDDAGKSWRAVATPVTRSLTNVDFENDKLGVAVGHGGSIVRTQDGGESWTAVVVEETGPDYLLGVTSLGGNPFAANSTANPYGRYGNPFSSSSIHNPYSRWGSRYSSEGARNPYTTRGPKLFADDGAYLGRLNANKYDADSVANPYGRRDNKVLVVDDDLEMCGLISDVLKGEGLTTTSIGDSLEASKILKREEFDVIITDLKMKGLKGLDLLEEAKKVAPLTPVIIHSLWND